MFFHFQVFLYSIIFVFGLELTVSEFAQELIAGLIGTRPWTASFVVLALMVYVFQVAKKIGKQRSMTAIPIFLALASLGLLYFIDSTSQKHAFVLISGLLYYFILLGIYRLRAYAKDQTARGIVAAVLFATLFFCFAVFYGIYINFAIPLWFLMVADFAVTVLLSVQYFYLLEVSQKDAWRYASVIGLVIVQISWVVTFWPFGYLTTGVIMLMFYYVLWDLVQAHFLDIVSKRRLVLSLMVVGALVSLVLMSASWLPVV